MKKIILAVAIVAVAAMGVVSSASAGVERYQEQTGVLTVTLPAHGYVHTYEITINPCGDGSFEGVSTETNVFGIDETITGTLLNGELTFTATYDDVVYSWNYNGPLTGGTAEDSTGQTFEVTSTFVGGAVSTWKNHGQYVAAQGGGSDAAHSCIGMPIS